jgi:DMSO/TMAO reductase YedYZ molybdopterin-dependent catalytic subunit
MGGATYRDRVSQTEDAGVPPVGVTERKAPATGVAVLYAVLGVLAAAFGVAIGTLVAAFIDPAYAPIEVVASTAIDLPPQQVKEWATSTFGTASKSVVVGVVVVAVVVTAAWAGITARTRPRFGIQVMIVAGLVGAVAALLRPVDLLLAPLPSIAAGAAAAVALWWLLRMATPADGVGAVAVPAVSDSGGAIPAGEFKQVSPSNQDLFESGSLDSSAEAQSVSRRGVLLGIGGVVVVGGAALASARWLTTRASAVASRVAAVLPTPAEALAPLPASVQAPVPGMAPFITPNADFYRIDTAVIVPQVTAEEWTLSFDGMVRRPFTLTYADLLDMPMVERDVTIMCVSNPIGGDLIGTARWLGTPLLPLLERAGIEPGADQLFSTSSDGWTCSTPLDGLAEREPLLAIGMNGEPLPIEHGFPVRMIIPGLYGFISATKWVTRISASTYAQDPAYWTVRGWATDAPVLTGSRIDLPQGSLTVGQTAIGGVAWAMDGDGISRVEVSIDDGPWQDAQLADQPTPRTWRQWWLEWEATPGRHSIAVRATNGLGETQTSEVADVVPSGATGYDVGVVEVA